MRNIKKTMMVKELELKVYDTRDKLEKLIEVTVSEVETGARIPEGCVLISEKVLSEKEVVYKMTPQDFVKYASIEK